MRILAAGKRDSVSGEEVVVYTSTERFNSGGAGGGGSSSSDNNSSAIIFGSGADSSNLPGKLNGVKSGIPGKNSAEKAGKRKRGEGKLQRGKLKSKKNNHQSSSITKSPCSWRGRAVGKSVAFLLNILNAYCCCSVLHKNERGECQRKRRGGGECYNHSGGLERELKDQKENLKYSSAEVSSTEPEPEKLSSSNPRPDHEGNSGKIRESIIDVTSRKWKVCTRDQIALSAGTANSKIMRSGIYHEKQVKSLCALHALNNLLQDGKAFKQEDLDKICSELDPNSWVNPHKSVFGLGNYDINVIMTALQQKKLEAIWFDKRKDPSQELNFDNIYGFILNIPSDCRLGWLALPIKRKHWVAIRNLPSVTERDAGRSNYYNLDSKFDKPESIGTTDSLIEYLRSELKSPEKELFLVVTEDIGRLETWRKNPPPPPSSAIASSSTSAATAGTSSSASSATQFLPVPTGDDVSAGSGNGNFRRTSNDSGVVDLLPDLRDINVVDLNKEDLMRRQSSGVWSDLT